MRPYRFMKMRLIVFATGLWMLVGTCFAWAAADVDSLTEGKSALRSGKYAEAGQFFESALKEGKDPEQGQLGLLQVLRITGAYKEAVNHLEEFLSARPDSAALNLEGGRIYRDTGVGSTA